MSESWPRPPESEHPNHTCGFWEGGLSLFFLCELFVRIRDLTELEKTIVKRSVYLMLTHAK